ncbi:MAG: hypothetical protein POELPBGB_01359 [Bacteroidia bacterium]|nr:hypothetical protein [Bacteroidia bacterium]
MKTLKSFLLTLFCVCYSFFTFGTSYTWTGTTSTAWGTNTNWSPNGIPGASDNVTIVSASNNPTYNGVAGVTNITMTSGTLNLGGYTMNVSGTGTFNGGTVTNGKLNISSSNTLTFAGTTMSCKVIATISGHILLNGSVFNDTTKFTKTGGFTTSTVGGNKFNGYTVITNQSTSGFYLNNASPYKPDTATNIVVFNQENSGTLVVAASNTSPSVFYEKVILNKKTGSDSNPLEAGSHGKIEFHDIIEVTNVTNNDIYIGHYSESKVTLMGDATVTVGGAGYTGRYLYFRYWDKQNETPINITLTGTAIFSSLSGNLINGDFTLSAPQIYTIQTRYYDDVTFTKTGATDNWSSGDNTFGGDFSLTNNGSGAIGFGTGSSPDSFLLKATFVTYNYNISVAHDYAGHYFGGDVYFKALGTGAINVSNYGGATFNGNIYLTSTSTGNTNFGQSSSNTLTLASGKNIIEDTGGFNSGSLLLRRFTKNGTIAANWDFGSSASVTIGPYTTINGTLTYSGGNIYLNGTTFNNNSTFTKTGTGNNTSSGGNIFNGTCSITNQTTSNITLANTTGDDFNSDVTFTNTTTGNIYPSYNSISYYAGNITANGGSLMHFGNGTTYCMSVLDGSNSQTISGTTTTIRFKKLTLNRSVYSAILSHSINVTDSLKFTTGFLQTGTYSVELNDNCIASGASDASYVDGKVKKTGNDAFTFPVGKSGQYRSIAISAPTNTTDAYTAEYSWTNSNPTYSHSSKDAGIAELSRAEYWKLDRNAGTTNVSVTLSWENSASCSFSNTANLKVAAWNGTTWKDKGNGGTTGTTSAGTIVTNGTSSDYGAYSLATTSTFDCYCFDATDLGNNNVTLNNQNFSTQVKWYKFKSDSSWTDIKIVNLGASTTANIEALEVFEACDGSGIKYGSDTITSSSDTVLLFRKKFNSANTYYYIKLTKTTTGTGTADFNFTLRGGNPNFNIVYQSPSNDCGINYAQVSHRLNLRFNAASGTTSVDPNPIPNGPVPNTDFVFSGIPSNAVIVRAFIWFTTVTTNATTGMKFNLTQRDYSLGSCPQTQTVTTTIPLTNTNDGQLGGLPTATCWGGVNSSSGTMMYFYNLTPLFTNVADLNGTYTLSNFLETTAGGDLALDGVGFDISGATIMLVYKTPCSSNTRPAKLVIWNGIQVIAGAPPGQGAIDLDVTGLNAFASNTGEKAFMIISDVETSNATYDINMMLPPSDGALPFTISPSPFERMHTYHELTSSSGFMPGFSANQDFIRFRYDHDGWSNNQDCAAVVAMGAYMQDANTEHVCTPINITASITDACAQDEHLNLSSTTTGGLATVTYSWGPAANITGSLTSQNTTGSGSTANQFIITATGADGCIAKDDVSGGSCFSGAVGGDYYACPTYNNTGTSTTFRSFYSISTQTFTIPSTSTLYINGTFTVNENLTIQGSGGNFAKILLAPNAKIIVNTNCTLTLNHCKLEPCEDYMWDGIYLSGTTSSVRITNASELYQAVNAIHSDNGGFFDVDNTSFLDCHIGIFVQNYHPSSLAAHPGKVITSTFKQNNNLLPPYNCDIYFAGIDVITVSKLTIGANTTTTNNLFDNLRYGVRMQQADVTLYRNSFANIEGTGLPLSPYNEGAIVALGNGITPQYMTQQLKVLGTSNTSTTRNNFTNCNYGVFAHRLPVDISVYNNFNDIGVGVWLRNSKTNTKVEQNYFSNSANGTAIRVQNLQSTAYAEQIKYNDITGHLRGIEIDNLKSARVWENDIDISNAGNSRRGITLTATRSTQVDDNTVDKTTAGNPGSGDIGTIVGILATNNYNPLIGDNVLTKMGSGITVAGSNPLSKLACNQHVTGYYGFRMLNAWTNNQVLLPVSGVWAERPTGNSWTTMVSSGSGGYDIAGNSIPIPSSWKYHGTGITDPTPNQCYSLILDNSTSVPCPFSPAQEPNDKSLRRIMFKEALLDTAVLGDFANGIRYYTKEWVYRTMRADNDWLSLETLEDDLYSDFYEKMEAGNMKQFILAEDTAEQGYISTARTINSAIIPTNTIEQYRQTVNDIYFKSWLQDTLTYSAADSATLTTIANLHAMTYGPGVYMARVLLGVYIEDDFDGASKTDEEWFPEEEQIMQFTKIYPNPNNGQMQMDYLLPEGSNGFLEVIDINGRSLQNYGLFEGMHTINIDISGQSMGLYFARLYVNGQYRYTDKIAVIK